MSFQQYNKELKPQCLEVFDSNVGKYFDPSERKDFCEYLDSIDSESCYYVYRQNEKVLACGGFNIVNGNASLTWGMVLREFHNQRLGSKLTDFRLSKIKLIAGVEKVKIQTSQHTSDFYSTKGFVIAKTTPNGFGEGIDCVEMELDVKRFKSS
ncbi:GNAT family N-acetyltransferase [Reinekea thalattae]|uniref:GNAT family N-acetyltransferase n=1 Tax=Reinekea thalattae TaxID=2593301 RepID=A0A5C8Z7S1_9GAMM|nr:GNAT family N-acetyltransferase [Reinekea thalattae]TXR53191.1 GNAT family N-acetyltransferase [Reinekea thalattae]